MSQFSQAFRYYSSSGRWSLINSTRPLQTSFWNFFVTRDQSISSIGEEEGRLIYSDYTPTGGNVVYRLPTPAPIGSGNKRIQQPIKIKTGYFLQGVTGQGQRRYASLSPVFNDVMNGMADKVAICIAHEISHSLGLMHEILIMSGTPYREGPANGSLSIMCCRIDANTFGRNMVFSSQAKLIWHRAFGVTSQNWNATYLQNKTWANNWSTVNWTERLRRFRRRHYETVMSPTYLSAVNPATMGPPPYAGTGSSVQRGTYVPPSSGSP
jgi:hypothetical protein